MKILAVFALSLMLFSALTAQVADDGVTHPLHKKYIGKIAFSKIDMSQAAMDEAKFVNEFTLGDLIYFRVFMKRSFANSIMDKDPRADLKDVSNNAKYRVIFTLNGGEPFETQTDFGTNSSENQKWTMWRGAFKHSRDQGFVGLETMRPFFGARNITPGKHKIGVTLVPYYKEIRGESVTGEFMLNVSALDPNDRSYCLPKPESTDESIRSAAIQAFKVKNLGQPTGVVITVPGWTIMRNRQTSVIEKRSAGVLIQTAEGGKCYSQYFTVAQDYSAGAYTSAYISNSTTREGINCGCVK